MVSRRYLCLVILATGAVAIGCGRVPGFSGAQSPADPKNEIKVDVANVGYDNASGTDLVVLRDVSGVRQLPIAIGENEAQAIALAMQGVKPERPLTDDLLESVITRTGNKVDRVEIDDVRDQIYYATIYLDGGRYSIDSRPSDAIAVAMGTHAPIYVKKDLLNNVPPVAMNLSGQVPNTAHAMGITVEQLTPDLAQCFGATGRRGVLVSVAGAGAAAMAGLAKGDVIEKVSGHEIGAPEEFTTQVRAAQAKSPVVLTVRRDGSERTVSVAASALAVNGGH
ncbi:MAG TPA: bifunctional nuclease domain-containing protein [Candidatus Binataceae bacterium]|nr:bifunctional nuclease domain-containing protein [Candidatus Binataceae bacterium]